jgi:predicted RNase H-like HicB family nuclease
VPQGESIEEALEMTKEAIELMLEALTEDGQEKPDDADPVETVSKVSVPV